MIPCWSGEVLSVAFAIDCHDREVFAWTASPRPLTGADIRTLMDKALWARFGERMLKVPHAIQWLSDNGPQYTATASVLYAHELGLVPITTPSRRERLRTATLNEIKQAARQLLVQGGPAAISLRAIARDMGLTAAALYLGRNARNA